MHMRIPVVADFCARATGLGQALKWGWEFFGLKFGSHGGRMSCVELGGWRKAQLEHFLRSWDGHLSSWDGHLSSWDRHLSSWDRHLSSWDGHLSTWGRYLSVLFARLSRLFDKNGWGNTVQGSKFRVQHRVLKARKQVALPFSGIWEALQVNLGASR